MDQRIYKQQQPQTAASLAGASMDRSINGPMHPWTGASMDRCIYGPVHLWTVESMTDASMDRCIHRRIHPYLEHP
jgi:hypothetical protein